MEPLSGVRVLDLTDGKAELTARLLGDLGADVIRVEPPEGRSSRVKAPVVDGVSMYDATRNTNKRSVVLDLAEPAHQDAFWQLVATAAIVVEDSPPGSLGDFAPAQLRARHPSLVVVSVTGFGQTGPYRDWAGTEAVHLALAGVLSRSGLPGRDPLLPPGHLASDSAATSAAWSALVAYTRALDTGVGDHVDVSIYEATAQVLDPGYGIGGSASAGKTAVEGPRGRPDARHLYPVFPCADGHVRLCVLAPRQWRGLWQWLGEPEELADPKLEQIRPRQRASGLIFPLVTAFFADRTRAQILAEGQQFGVPAGAVLTPSEVLTNAQFGERGAFVEVEVAPGRRAKVVNGTLELDGERAGVRRAAPELGEHTEEVLSQLLPAMPAPVASVAGRPLEGLRVLDLGVIVVGAETGRLLADMGAEVIKVENRAFIDGSRAAGGADTMTTTFAWGSRNKLSLGLNLRDDRGRDLLLRLVADADVVLSNFKPGTMESLGLGNAALAAVNPRLIVVDSSAYGPTGPWSRRMGYGPLVRAEAAVSALWRYPDSTDSFSDASTIYPDHVAARVGALAVLARLVERRRTGVGGAISIAQAEVILDHYGPELAAESLAPGSMNQPPGEAPHGVFPCAGDDEWVVVTTRDDHDWQRLATAIGRPELATDPRFANATVRVAHRIELDAILTEWTVLQPPRLAMELLQAAGVPAGMMQRVSDYADDPHLRARSFLRSMEHPLLAGSVPCEAGPAHFLHVPDPPHGPAPMLGEHTREICTRLLGLSEQRVDELLADGVIEEWRQAVGAEV